MANDEKHSSVDSCLGCLFATVALKVPKVLFLWAMGWLDVVYTWRNLKIAGGIILGLIALGALGLVYDVIKGKNHPNGSNVEDSKNDDEDDKA